MDLFFTIDAVFVNEEPERSTGHRQGVHVELHGVFLVDREETMALGRSHAENPAGWSPSLPVTLVSFLI